MPQLSQILCIFFHDGNYLVLLALAYLLFLKAFFLENEHRNVHVVPILLLPSINFPQIVHPTVQVWLFVQVVILSQRATYNIGSDFVKNVP